MAQKKRHDICKECGMTRREFFAAGAGYPCERYDPYDGEWYWGEHHVWTY